MYLMVEIRDAAKALQCRGQGPTTQNYPSPSINTGKVEKPSLRGN